MMEYRSLDDAKKALTEAETVWEKERGRAAAEKIVGSMLMLNRFAKEERCDEKTASRIYTLKHDLIGWFYNEGYCQSVRLVNNEKKIPCRSCGGTGVYSNPLTLTEMQCSLCAGSGHAPAFEALLSSSAKAATYYAVLVDFAGNRFIWHIRADRGRKRGLLEKNPKGIQDHRLQKW